MLVYILDKKKKIWCGFTIKNTINIGLKSKNEFSINVGKQRELGQFIQVSDSYKKQKTVLLLKQNCGIKLNGMLPFSLTVLRHKDELSYQGQKIYFSTEHPIQVVKFDKKRDGKVNCPRCKDKIEGESVQCPRCKLWFHESEGDRQCWSYDKKCLCGYPTDAKTVWKPNPVKLKPKRNDCSDDKPK